MNKIYLNWDDITKGVNNIILEMFKDNWKPDLIVGVTRGGLIPAVMLSKKTGIPMKTLDVDTIDEYKQSNILIVDDINAEGKTLEYIQTSWKLGDTWNQNVRVACIVSNESSSFDIDYSTININRLENNAWVVFPWET